eukprot:1340534-Karenia_brevis.AAC.1
MSEQTALMTDDDTICNKKFAPCSCINEVHPAENCENDMHHDSDIEEREFHKTVHTLRCQPLSKF